MANEVYKNQELTVIYTDTDGVDMSALNLRVDYWAPGNQSDTPTGTIASGNVSAVLADVTIFFAKDILNQASKPTGEKWRYQIIDNDSEIGWTVRCIDVLKQGQQNC